MRQALQPQRRHGKARVAAVLEAAAAIIAEKGYDGTTMAEIAVRANAPIGSLYRFFPNKDILAAELIQRYVALVNQAFDAIDGQIGQQSLEFIADAILDLKTDLHQESRAMVGLLEAHPHWSDKRRDFRDFVHQRIAKTLMLCAPALPRREAGDIAVILLQNMKTMKGLTFGRNLPASPSAVTELRRMNRVYLVDRLGKGPSAAS